MGTELPSAVAAAASAEAAGDNEHDLMHIGKDMTE